MKSATSSLLPLWEKVDRRFSAERDEGCWTECNASFLPAPLIRPRLGCFDELRSVVRLGHLLPQGEKEGATS
jgi:hypothetical protein